VRTATILPITRGVAPAPPVQEPDADFGTQMSELEAFFSPAR